MIPVEEQSTPTPRRGPASRMDGQRKLGRERAETRTLDITWVSTACARRGGGSDHRARPRSATSCSRPPVLADWRASSRVSDAEPTDPSSLAALPRAPTTRPYLAACAPCASRGPARRQPAAVAPATSAGKRTRRAVEATVSPASLTLRPALDPALPFEEGADFVLVLDAMGEPGLAQDLADLLGLVAHPLDVLRHVLRRLAELLAHVAERLGDRLHVELGQRGSGIPSTFVRLCGS